jgi:hypothetical protein
MRGLNFENDQWPRAAEEFRKAASSAPQDDVLFFNLGLVYRRNGLLASSLQAFEHSAEINPRLIAGGPASATAQVEAGREELDRVQRLESSFGPPPQTAPEHRDIADLLMAHGESLSARGHRLRAEELEAGAQPR